VVKVIFGIRKFVVITNLVGALFDHLSILHCTYIFSPHKHMCVYVRTHLYILAYEYKQIVVVVCVMPKHMTVFGPIAISN